ncbi:unnamed protein product [Blepharisma stoltei]|uniref:RING-CH-type domain-containing protein n=1 Tax=Blepharisma stoltei TaxID=1481888 RepID=A0AAU9JU18_9CILI|nr:unnamed protein product [Blepharisma stoltei]
MSFECRICLNSQNQENIISPCKCMGSIKYVHEACLQKWLKEKYKFRSLLARSRAENTGLACELCKYELKGSVKFMPFLQILKTIRRSQSFYCAAINIPVILYIIYRLKFLFTKLIKTIRKKKVIIQLQETLSRKIFMYLKLQLTIWIRLVPISVLSMSLPIIIFTTCVLIKSIIAECKIYEIKNYEPNKGNNNK